MHPPRLQVISSVSFSGTLETILFEVFQGRRRRIFGCMGIMNSLPGKIRAEASELYKGAV
jgi:hypothetical protein